MHKIIEQTIARCPGTKSISMILLFGHHQWTKWKKLFDTIAKNGLKINLKKCVFGVQELTFANLKLTNKGIKAKVPTNVTEVRSF